MVAVYPGSGVVVAVIANLGHAKLPFRPLVNIVGAFLPWPTPDIPIVAIVMTFLAAALWAIRRRVSTRAAQRGLQPMRVASG